MVFDDLEELQALQQEFDWLLNEEVNDILTQLHDIVVECCRRFPIRLESKKAESLVKSEKFSFQCNGAHNDHLRVNVQLTGDNLTCVELNIRLHKHNQPNQHFLIPSDNSWKLNQIQDAANHLTTALDLLTSPPLRFSYDQGKYDFHSADEVIQLINTLMSCLQKGRSALFVPKKRTIEELQTSRNMKVFIPTVPSDIAISFYVQSHKLVCALYHINKDSHNNWKYDVLQADASIPWLSEALVLFTVSLQFCQQLKDKLSVFIQYREIRGSGPTSLQLKHEDDDEAASATTVTTIATANSNAANMQNQNPRINAISTTQM